MAKFSGKRKGMSAEAFDVEDNSFCNVMSVSVAREVIVDISDRGLEDLNNMGLGLALAIGLDQNNEVETQISVGNDLGLNEKVTQCPDNVESLKLNQISSYLLDSEGPRDRVTADEVEEKSHQIRQNKRNKKVLNKNIRSM
ncbi:hypothetical protein Gotur_027370, partial [Gossypium turneri]